VAIYYDEEYTPRNADVVAAIPVDAGAELPSGGRARIGELPGRLMVSVVRRGPWDDFSDAYQAIMDWVEANDYEITGPNREIHWQGPPSGVPPEEYIMEIQFPIKKRER
jgi:effector-binding domain-containing protein